MRMVEIKQLPNGSHNNQICDLFTEENCPEGWAVIPDNVVCENYPFGTAVVEGNVVVEWIPCEVPEEPEKSAQEKREIAYNTEEVIEWQNKMITVTEAAKLWNYYAAEGSEVADQLTVLIFEAKTDIRRRFPD